MPLSYRILTAVVALNAAFFTGWMVNGWRIGNAQIVASNNQISALAEIEQLAAVSENSVLRFTADQSREAIKYVVKNPTDCRITDIGLQQWRNANATPTSSTNSGVSTPAATRIGQSQSPVFKSYRDSGTVSPVRQSTHRTEPLDKESNPK